MIRLSMHKLVGVLDYYVVIHVKSNLPGDYIEQLQAYLEARKDPDCSFYDPDFPWDTAKVLVLYFGLKEEPDEWAIQLPDGRAGHVFNINPGSANCVARVLKDYSAAMDIGRTALLFGGTPEEAAQEIGEYCRDNLYQSEYTEDLEKAARLRAEMEEYQMILLDDIRSMDAESERGKSENL